MKKMLLFLAVFLIAGQLKAWEERNMLQKGWTLEEVKSALISNHSWVPYPQYKDSQGWDSFLGPLKDDLVADGQKALERPYHLVLATDYMDFERTGTRTTMEQPFHANVNRLSSLMMAELAEGKGRFIDEIINGVWMFCDMKGWASPAHLNGSQPSKRALPDDSGVLIDLVSGDLSALLSWCHYFFKDAMDRVNPYFAQRLRHELKARTMDPYMKRDNYWWQAFNIKPGSLVNNWNVWCNSNVLITFLLMEDDADKLATAVYRTMRSVDQFLNYNHEDGGCEEGPSYWGHAAGKLYDYLQVLAYATNNKISLFQSPMVKNLGEYIVNSYIGEGWVVNFADASAKGDGLSGLVFRYGQAVGSQSMQEFGSYLLHRGSLQKYFYGGRDFFRTMENVASYSKIVATSTQIHHADHSWYPQTEFCYMRNQSGWFFAGKGGYNDESHNHNDIGTFILYLNNHPVFIDAGVGTYTRKTFSSERYSIWTMQSNYHNLPVINGVPQSYGKKYRSTNISFNKNQKLFSLDIAKAYKEEAGVKQWKRSYQLKSKGGLVITDQYVISNPQKTNELVFMTQQKPDISRSGVVALLVGGQTVKMSYDAKLFTSAVEVVELDDTRLSNVWGPQIYRLVLTATAPLGSGTYRFVVDL